MQNEQKALPDPFYDIFYPVLSQEPAIILFENLVKKINDLMASLKSRDVDNDDDELYEEGNQNKNSSDLQTRGLFTMVQDIAQLFTKVRQLEINVVNAINNLHTRLTTIENQFPNLTNAVQQNLPYLINSVQVLMPRVAAAEKLLETLTATTIPLTQQLTFVAPSATTSSAAVYSASSSSSNSAAASSVVPDSSSNNAVVSSTSSSTTVTTPAAPTVLQVPDVNNAQSSQKPVNKKVKNTLKIF